MLVQEMVYHGTGSTGAPGEEIICSSHPSWRRSLWFVRKILAVRPFRWVNTSFRRWHVIMYDIPDIRDVKTSRCDVGSHQDRRSETYQAESVHANTKDPVTVLRIACTYFRFLVGGSLATIFPCNRSLTK